MTWKSLHPKCRGTGTAAAGGAVCHFLFFLSLQILSEIQA